MWWSWLKQVASPLPGVVAVVWWVWVACCQAVASVGSTGDSYDNALAEALNSLYKAELIYNTARPGYTGPWRDRREVERETSAWVHWYNTSRPHLALGGITPQQAENQHTTTRKEAA